MAVGKIKGFLDQSSVAVSRDSPVDAASRRPSSVIKTVIEELSGPSVLLTHGWNAVVGMVPMVGRCNCWEGLRILDFLPGSGDACSASGAAVYADVYKYESARVLTTVTSQQTRDKSEPIWALAVSSV